MEIPNRKVLRDLIIYKVRNGWDAELEGTDKKLNQDHAEPDNLLFKYSLNRKERKDMSKNKPIVTNEWVEPISIEDNRYR